VVTVFVIWNQQFHCVAVISVTGHPVLESARSVIGFPSSQRQQRQEVRGYLSPITNTDFSLSYRAYYLQLPTSVRPFWPPYSPGHIFLPWNLIFLCRACVQFGCRLSPVFTQNCRKCENWYCCWCGEKNFRRCVLAYHMDNNTSFFVCCLLASGFRRMTTFGPREMEHFPTNWTAVGSATSTFLHWVCFLIKIEMCKFVTY
jgi:hypothetical protein